MSIKALLNSWKILFRETKLRYCSKRAATRSSLPYFTVHPFSFVSVKCRKAIKQHYEKIIKIYKLCLMSHTLCSKNLSFILLWAARLPIVANRVVMLCSCGGGTSRAAADSRAASNCCSTFGSSAKNCLCSSSFLLITAAVPSFIYLIN